LRAGAEDLLEVGVTKGRRMGGGAGRRWGGGEAEQADDGEEEVTQSRPATGRRGTTAADPKVEEEEQGQRGPTDPASRP
jgi:hypothetical protein